MIKLSHDEVGIISGGIESSQNEYSCDTLTINGGIVSDEMQFVLDRLVGVDIIKDRKEEVKRIQELNIVKKALMCEWYGSCYYCKEAVTGKWTKVACIA